MTRAPPLAPPTPRLGAHVCLQPLGALYAKATAGADWGARPVCVWNIPVVCVGISCWRTGQDTNSHGRRSNICVTKYTRPMLGFARLWW